MPNTTGPGHSEEMEAWRRRARTWLEANASPRRKDDEIPLAGRRDDDPVARARRFQRNLQEAGFAGITWPREYGGAGLSLRHQLAFTEEAAEFEVPTRPLGIGLGMCGPTILAHSTEPQKERYLPAMLRGDEIWCQLFSEPGAGSDLASIRTRAKTVEGGGWRITGQKIWTSVAHLADLGLLLARTDPSVPKHAGLTMFVVDMRWPGVVVRPLREITGETNFNEVFLDEVLVPDDHVIGDVGQGWRAAMTMLASERMSIGGAGGSGWRGHSPEALVRLARSRDLVDDPVVRRGLAEVHIMRTALRLFGDRVRERVIAGRSVGSVGAIAKLVGAELAQRSSELGLHLSGLGGVGWDSDRPGDARWTKTLLASRAASIAGGTDEILKNLIAERVLGLPKEPRYDKGVPFDRSLLTAEAEIAGGSRDRL